MTNEETAFRFFVAQGFPDYQAAGVIGNLIQESNLNPGEAAREAAGYLAHGVAQWGPPRWAALQAWAGARDPYALETQLGYVVEELNKFPSLGLAQLREATNVRDAAVTFEKLFERSKPGSTKRRVALAEATLAKFTGKKPPPYIPPAPTIVVSEGVGGVVALTVVALGVAVGAAYALRRFG